MDSILALANQKNVDLIVMGTHGRSGLDRFLLGSTTEKILRKARCPVLVVRKPVNRFVKPEDRRDPVHPRKILSCTDFSKHSEMALKYALSLATEFSAELTLLHVLEDVPRSPEVKSVAAEVLRDLEALVPREAIDWCTIRPVIRIGKPYQEIIQLALEARSDLIVLGVRGRSALDLALFGSTTHRVIQLGTCPVLAVQI